MLARSGGYTVRSRVIDDDNQVWLDFEWGELRRLICLHAVLIYSFQARKGVVDDSHHSAEHTILTELTTIILLHCVDAANFSLDTIEQVTLSCP